MLLSNLFQWPARALAIGKSCDLMLLSNLFQFTSAKCQYFAVVI